METHTAKHFALQLGSLASLYLSLSFLLVLIFSIVNLLFPDATDSIWQTESYSSSARLGIAMTLVFFPTYLILTRLINTSRRKNTDSNYLTLTKWLIYLSLLVGGAVLLGDLVAVIFAFLEGEITVRFILKALAVLVVVGAAFSYYLLDARGYWLTHEQQSIAFGGVALAIVILALILGFMNIDTPAEVREQKLDATQVQDLQNIQWRIQEYLMINEELPESLSDIYDTVSPPEAPEDRPAYRYELTDDGFALCATFSTESRRDEFPYFARPKPVLEETTILNPDNWEHGTGEVCFERVVKLGE